MRNFGLALVLMTLFNVPILAQSQVSNEAAEEQPLKSTAQMQDDVWTSYRLIKSLVAEELDRYEVEVDGGFGGDYQVIGPCAAGSQLIVTSGRLRPAMIDIATEVCYAEHVLRRINYPEELWEDILEISEEISMIVIQRGDNELHSLLFEEYFVRTMNIIAKKDGRKLPILGPAECGGGPNILTIKIIPREAKVYMIPKIFYKYCKITGIDPLDREHCDHWLPPVRNGEKIELGGVYEFILVEGNTVAPLDEIDTDRYDEVLSFEM